MVLSGTKENLGDTFQQGIPPKRSSTYSSLAANRAFRQEQLVNVYHPDTKQVFERTPGSFKFRSSPSIRTHVKQIKPESIENSSSVHLLDGKLNDKYTFNEAENENDSENKSIAYSSCGDIVVESSNEGAKYAIRSSNRTLDEPQVKVNRRKITSMRMPREISKSNSSTFTGDEVFYEASPVFDQSDEDIQTVKYGDFEARELEEFNRNMSPKYDYDGNMVSLPKYYPTLLVESFFPIVDVDVSPHMTKPLAPINTPLDLTSLINSQSSLMIAPFCDIHEHVQGTGNDETSLLNILTEEIALLEMKEQEVPKPSFSAKQVARGIKGFFKLFFREEDYEEKYPWTKYLHDKDDVDDYESKTELVKEYDLDDFYAQTHF